MIKKLTNIDLEYNSIKAKLEGLGEKESFDILLQKMQELEKEIGTPLSKNKRTAKTIW